MEQKMIRTIATTGKLPRASLNAIVIITIISSNSYRNYIQKIRSL
ncbi:MAG: hypothetical protein V8R81_01510 [Clostridia bacterium]